ncbi:nuclear transport factor 2 family protein [Dactylosporangium sp. NPDC051541]|uniref:nuclear transport factor 2 family protein n=1 Tax=Dactylosporangium sp. NPDC051541 TaxID=3363977 RepID=UPI0037A96E76
MLTDVLARRRELILGGNADGFADLFAADAVIEMPFGGPPGAPTRLAGREAIRAYSRQVMAAPLRLEEYEVTTLHRAADPEVVIVEMRTSGVVTTTNRPFTAIAVQILRIRDGRIVHVRDFPDPRGLQGALGD